MAWLEIYLPFLVLLSLRLLSQYFPSFWRGWLTEMLQWECLRLNMWRVVCCQILQGLKLLKLFVSASNCCKILLVFFHYDVVLGYYFLDALCERLLDFDENVRKQVVAVICDVACHALVPFYLKQWNLLLSVFETNLQISFSHFIFTCYLLMVFIFTCLLTLQLLVKKYTLERLAEIYRVCCVKSVESSDGSIKSDEFDWIPGKVLRCFYDKDFR